MIVLGIILLIIGFVAKIAILWTLGIIALVIGAILAILGMAGHAIGGRRHYFLSLSHGSRGRLAARVPGGQPGG